MDTQRTSISNKWKAALAIFLVAVLAQAAPADAAKPTRQTMRPVTPKAWTLVEESNGCGTASVAVCSASTTPSADPGVLQPHLSVVDPVDPVTVPTGANKYARYRQFAEVTTTKAVRSVAFDWTFTIAEPLGATTQATQGATSWSTQITMDAATSWTRCEPVLSPQVIMLEENTTIPAGTTYTYRFTFAPCIDEPNIPAGTTMSLIADVWLNVGRNPTNGGWNGRADLTGTIRSAIASNAI